ncbi:MAG TPA: Nramp family divalent metal transporter [Chloroflexota bacterium]|nr:Nramp family divalent metal transporter [Chloroflexota bacterium]
MLRRLFGEERLAVSGRGEGTAAAAVAVLRGAPRPWYARLWPFLGPAFIAAVAYIDPGNFATNIQAGAQFGYQLVWTVVAANLVAMLVQSLSAKLGIATGLNLAEVCREYLPRPLVYVQWAIAEIVAMATDLAEFLGAALGLNLLFHIPLFAAGLLTGLITFVILGLERYGFRPLEALISAFVGVIALCYIIETFFDRPSWLAIGQAILTPRLGGGEDLLLAVGIIGATVMPHVIFLHSHLTQSRIVVQTPRERQRLFRFEIIDVVLAMGIAGLVNVAMLVMAASTFFRAGLHDIGTIEEAYRTLTPLLGTAAGTIFAISLLASGLSSSTVGTMAGQVVMQGFLRRRVPLWFRRAVTMLPALAVIALGIDPTRALVISQVTLSFGLPFALIPLVLFTRQRAIMKELVNRRLTTAVASLATVIIVALNLFLLAQVISG